jgi:hypothetical protein
MALMAKALLSWKGTELENAYVGNLRPKLLKASKRPRVKPVI